MRSHLAGAILVSLAILNSTPPAAGATTAMEDIVATWQDADGRQVLLREGYWEQGNGFGREKIAQKHKITNMEVVKAIIGNPDGGTPKKTYDKKTRKLTRDRRTYTGFANRLTCRMDARCDVVERIPLVAVVEYLYDFAFQGQVGVMTAYCKFDSPAQTDCPSWVNKQANIAH